MVNEFYRLDGLKFSTSRRHAVWALDALRRGRRRTSLRCHVLADRPERPADQLHAGRRSQRARDHLDELWNGWLARLFAAVGDGLRRRRCRPSRRPGRSGSCCAGRLARIADELREAYSVGRVRPPAGGGAARRGRAAAPTDFGYVHATNATPARPTARRSPAQLAAASALAAWAAPALPDGAARLSQALGVPAGRRVHADALVPPPAGSRLPRPPVPVFGSRPR